MLKNGDLVSIEYTLKLDDGSVADTNVGGEPLTFKLGEGQILPALEKKLVGTSVEETMSVTLGPEDGYGPVKPDAFIDVDLQQIPEEGRKVGERLVARDSSGRTIPVRIHEIREDTAVMDMNHPLAGQQLHFEIKVLQVA